MLCRSGRWRFVLQLSSANNQCHDQIDARFCAGGQQFLIFFSFLFFKRNPLGYDRPQTSLRTRSSLAPSPLFFPFLLFLAAVLALPPTLGVAPPEFSQADPQLLEAASIQNTQTIELHMSGRRVHLVLVFSLRMTTLDCYKILID